MFSASNALYLLVIGVKIPTQEREQRILAVA